MTDLAHVAPDVKSVERFLEELFGSVADDQHRIMTGFLRPEVRFTTWPTVTDAIHGLSANDEDALDQYFGCCLIGRDLDPSRHQKSNEGDVTAVTAAWADVDCRAPFRGDKSLPETKDEAIAFVKSCFAGQIQPTAIIDSGWGIQCWWLFADPIPIRDEEDRARAKRITRGIHGEICRAGAERGWVFENCGNLDRVLRLPGTTNHKVQGDPRPVEILEANYEIKYDLDEFEPYARAEESAAELQPSVGHYAGLVYDKDAMPPGKLFEELMASCEKFRTVFDEDPKSGRDLSGCEQTLANIARQALWSDQEILDLLIYFRHRWAKYTRFPDKVLGRPDYVARTLHNAGPDMSKARTVDVSGLIESFKRKHHLARQDSQGEEPAPAGSPEAPVGQPMVDAASGPGSTTSPLGLTATKTTPKLAICSGRDLIEEHKELPPPLVDGLLRRGETGSLVAPSKLGKSMLVLDLAASVATGTPWCGSEVAGPGRVLIVDGEIGPDVMAARLRLLCDARGLGESEFLDRVYFSHTVGWTADDLVTSILADESCPYDLIVFDAMYCFLRPDASENDNAEMARLIRVFQTLAKMHKVTVLIVHHLSKGDQSGKDVIDLGAGAGAVGRAVDTVIALRHHEVENVAVMEARCRSFVTPQPRCIEFAFPCWNPCPDGLDPSRLFQPGPGRRRISPADHLARGEKKAAKEEARDLTAEEFVERFVSDEPRRQSAILAAAQGVGISESRARGFLDQACDDLGIYKSMVKKAIYYSTKPAGNTGSTPSPGPDVMRVAAELDENPSLASMTHARLAEHLGISLATVRRARSWLKQRDQQPVLGEDRPLEEPAQPAQPAQCEP